MQSWAPAAAGSWQTIDLSGSPYNVPANAVVEIAISNEGANVTAGVRAVGSALQRRLPIRAKDDSGARNLVLYSQADASSQIQYYASVTPDVMFTLLGYWDGATYTEAAQSLTPSGTGSWVDQGLS